MRAAQELQRLVAEEAPNHRMPRMTNKKVAELIAVLSDSQRFLETKFYTLKEMGKNFVAFQDELTQLQPFMVRCMAKTIPLFHEFVLSLKPEQFTEVRRAGLRGMRNGAFQMYYGALQMAKTKAKEDARMKVYYEERLLQAMAETAPRYASILPPSTRRQVFDLAKAGENTETPNLSGYFKKIAEAMSSTACEGLCKF